LKPLRSAATFIASSLALLSRGILGVAKGLLLGLHCDRSVCFFAGRNLVGGRAFGQFHSLAGNALGFVPRLRFDAGFASRYDSLALGLLLQNGGVVGSWSCRTLHHGLLRFGSRLQTISEILAAKVSHVAPLIGLVLRAPDGSAAELDQLLADNRTLPQRAS
jgi:hypothetical protein